MAPTSAAEPDSDDMIALSDLAPAATRWLAGFGCALALVVLSPVARAAPKQGDALQTNSLSMLVVNRDFTTERTSSIHDVVNGSATIGLHYYIVDGVRLGMGLQATERLWPEPAPGVSRLQRFALMPQIGWSCCDPFYTALIFSYAPRTLGRANPDLAVIPVIGVGAPITERAKISFALEAPLAFYYHRALGVVALTGVSFLL